MAATFITDVTTEKKPWTHLDFGSCDGDDFNFAIFSDRSGRPQPGIYEDAIRKVNMMCPEFVMSIGDYVESLCNEDHSEEFFRRQWAHFDEIIAPCRPPFFYLVGNHDLTCPHAENNTVHDMMERVWKERFGVTYYYFIRKGVLFLCLHSTDRINYGLGDEQTAWALKTIREHTDVRWTMVFIHDPNAWLSENFQKIEDALYERNYSVFAGHKHRYVRYRRNGRDYYMLGMTGCGQPHPAEPARGVLYGEFHHLTWVSFYRGEPHVSLLALDNIYDDGLVTTPKITWLTAKYFRADKPLPPEEMQRLSDKGIRVANSKFFEDWDD